MSTLTERLRDVMRPGGSERQDPPYVSERQDPPYVSEKQDPPYVSEKQDPPSVAAGPTNVAETLGGDWCDLHGQTYLIVERTYPPGHRHGHVTVADASPPESGAWPRLPVLVGATARWLARSASRLLFFDLETTGLAGGAGTYAFLVGCGWFDGGTFRTRQLFLSNFAAERALLQGLADSVRDIDAVVTYNGKTFDVPLIDTRYLLHRMQTPFGDLPHLDMLYHARRLWRADADESSESQASCRLSALEHTVCGHDREGDVPGFEIPSRYFHYVRTGDARPLEGVLEHNRLDLLSLALLTARAAQLLEEGPDAARNAREAVGLGRLYERAGDLAQACSSYSMAAGMGDAPAITRAEALRACAVLNRRQRRYEEAATAWRRLLALPQCPAHVTREATEALAVHHEHRLRDLHEARRLALQALQFQATVSRHQAVHHRLARLNRKLGKHGDTAALF